MLALAVRCSAAGLAELWRCVGLSLALLFWLCSVGYLLRYSGRDISCRIAALAWCMLRWGAGGLLWDSYGLNARASFLLDWSGRSVSGVRRGVAEMQGPNHEGGEEAGCSLPMGWPMAVVLWGYGALMVVGGLGAPTALANVQCACCGKNKTGKASRQGREAGREPR